MVFKRKIYQQLLDWKKEPNKNSALLIEGARRIGKTTIVKEFGKNEYSNYLYIDFTYYKKGKLNAVEVKSTTRFEAPSINALNNKYPQLKINKMIISPKTTNWSSTITGLPIYMSFLL